MVYFSSPANQAPGKALRLTSRYTSLINSLLQGFLTKNTQRVSSLKLKNTCIPPAYLPAMQQPCQHFSITRAFWEHIFFARLWCIRVCQLMAWLTASYLGRRCKKSSFWSDYKQRVILQFTIIASLLSLGSALSKESVDHRVFWQSSPEQAGSFWQRNHPELQILSSEPIMHSVYLTGQTAMQENWNQLILLKPFDVAFKNTSLMCTSITYPSSESMTHLACPPATSNTRTPE